MPTSKRVLLVKLLERCGIMRVLEALVRRCGLLVLNYHRIGSPDGNLLDDALFSTSTEGFRRQMGYLRCHFDLPQLEKVIETAEAGFQFERPTALVTFDDG